MDETIADQFISLIRGESVADSANVLGCGGGPHSIGGAGLADDGQLSSPVCINPDIHHPCKSCASKRRTRYLPQDMLFDIFSRLPAQVLHDAMRHVCREWSLVIRSQNFTHHHFRNSNSGIIIQKRCFDGKMIYVEMRRGCLEICKFDWGFRDRVWSSCNGLVLAADSLDLYVINPLTKQRAILPHYFHEARCLTQFRLAFVETSMEYKVVQASCINPYIPDPYIAVLTIGVDKVWRHIDMKHLSFASMVAFLSPPVVTGAYIHWIGLTFVLTFDVETETLRQFPLPQLPYNCRNFLPMGSNLSVVSESIEFVSEPIEFFRDVWEMNPKTGKWIKLVSFDLGPLSYKFPNLFPEFLYLIIPFGWLEVREVLLFSSISHRDITPRCCVAYNIKTREMQSFELDTMPMSYRFRPHVNSLVRLEGGF